MNLSGIFWEIQYLCNLRYFFAHKKIPALEMI